MNRRILIIAIGLIFAGACALIWRLSPIRHTYYTDAETIRAPIGYANIREILWQPPILAPSPINSAGDDYEPRISADGQTMFVVRGKAGANAEIHVARLQYNVWSELGPLSAVNSDEDDLGPEPSADGRALYFYSNRTGGLGGYDLWVAHLGPAGWQEPINLGPGVNSPFNDYGPALTPDGATLYFSSNRPQPLDVRQPNPNAWPATLREDLFHRTYDLYVAAVTPSGAGDARPLTPLNTPFNEGAAAVSPFGDFLYFASDRPGGSGGFDLYRARRIRGELSPAETLGAALNTPANELDPALGLGGFRLYFSSDRAERGTSVDGSRVKPSLGAPREYNVFYSTSREVFRDTELEPRPPVDWAALWQVIGPVLPWLVLALLSLLLLLALLRSMRQKQMSLMAKCLMGSLLAHVSLMLLLTFWQVTTAIASGISRGGPIRIALVSPSAGNELVSMIRGSFTEIESQDFETSSISRLETAIPAEFRPVEAILATSRATIPEVSPAKVQLEANDSDVAPSTAAATTPAPSTRAVDRVPIDVAAPIPPRPAQSREVQADAAAYVSAADPGRAPPTSPVMRPSDASVELSVAAKAIDFVPASSVVETAAADSRSAPAITMTRQSAPIPAKQLSATTIQLGDVASQPSRTVEETPSSVPPEQTTSPRREAQIASPILKNAMTQVVAVQSHGPDVAPAFTSPVIAPSATRDAAPGISETAPAITPIRATPDLFALNADIPTPLEKQKTLDTDAISESAASPSPAGTAGASLRAPSSLPTSDGPRIVELRATASHTATEVFARGMGRVEGSIREASMTTAMTPSTQSGVSSAAPAQTVEIALPRGTAMASASPEPAGSTPVAEAQNTRVRRAPASTQKVQPAATFDVTPRALSSSPAIHDVKFVDKPREAATALSIFAGGSPAPARPVASLTPPISLDLNLPSGDSVPPSPYVQRQSPDRLDIVKRLGGTEETENAVSLALAWLARHQSPDGRWDPQDFDDGCGGCGGETQIRAEIALTGLATLSFLGAGHTHHADGLYRDNVRRGIDWMLAKQESDGDLRGQETMYSHGIASIALSEAYSMTKDERLKPAVEQAVRFICSARNKKEGGWRYDPGQAGDTSVLGWQVMALKSASLAGIPVPRDAFDTARRWLDKVSSPPRHAIYSYMPGRPAAPSMTAEAMFVQQLLGQSSQSRRMQSSADFLVRHLPDWEEAPNTYFWYYASLALYQHGGPAWETWNEALTRELLKHQITDGHPAGSWDPFGEWAELGGRVYQTALCTLMLEVYYRYLPLSTLGEGAVTDEPIVAVGHIHGVVRDAATGEPIDGAAVVLEVADRAAITARSDGEGRYQLQVPEMPNFFALSASHDGYVPRSANVDEADLKGGRITIDFSLTPASEAVIVMEATPEVHHLGDDHFSGAINSQFQRGSEGSSFTTGFELAQRQVAPNVSSAEIRMMVKGVQRRHSIYINETRLDRRLDRAPGDGSFGEFRVPFDMSLLRAGPNSLRIVAAPSEDDIDDFEFVNIQVHLSP